MSKIIKIFVKTAADEPDIFCIKHDNDSTLSELKTKILLRCPLLKDKESQVYWIDNEGDKINIVCDDDFKFFMGEDACLKLIFNFAGSTKFRKRSISSEGDIITEYTKKVRKQLQSIDITSDDSSSMEIESGDENPDYIRKTRNNDYSKCMEDSTNQSEAMKSRPRQDDDPIPSTSEIMTSSNEAKTPSSFSYGSLECSSIEIVGESVITDAENIDESTEVGTNESQKKDNIEILDVQVIKPADDCEILEVPVQSQSPESNENSRRRVEADVIIVDDQPNTEESKIQKSNEEVQHMKPRNRSTSNRISISDSEEENDNEGNNGNETGQNTSDNNNNGQRQYASAYSFTNLNGDRFESASRTETCGGRRRHFHRSRSFRPNSRRFEEPSFQEQMRSFHRSNAENFDRIQENIRATGESVQRTFSATAAMFPDLATTFRSHFVRPLFGSGVHQHFFDNGYHH